jgi:hypothetical protein
MEKKFEKHFVNGHFVFGFFDHTPIVESDLCLLSHLRFRFFLAHMPAFATCRGVTGKKKGATRC